MQIQKVLHKRLYEDVLDQLMEQLRTGALAPGSPLPPERQLAEDFGVSRGTLREAFRILEAGGILETRQGGGRYVRADVMGRDYIPRFLEVLRASTSENLYEVRLLIETGIAELACERATGDDLADLENSIAQMESSDYDPAGPLREYFHLILANATHNALMPEMVRVNLDIYHQNYSHYGIRDKAQIIAEHREILEAVRTRDPERAKTAVRAHIVNARQYRYERK